MDRGRAVFYGVAHFEGSCSFDEIPNCTAHGGTVINNNESGPARAGHRSEQTTMGGSQKQYENDQFSTFRMPTSKAGAEEGDGRRTFASDLRTILMDQREINREGLPSKRDAGFHPIDINQQPPVSMPVPNPMATTPPPHRQRGQMLLEGRKHARRAERFLVQVSSVHDPLLIDLASVENQSPHGVQLATERSWELGSHVDVKSVVGDLKARARVVYCMVLGPKKFVVGLNILSRDSEQDKPPAKD